MADTVQILDKDTECPSVAADPGLDCTTLYIEDSGIIRSASASFAGLLGYAPEELVGRTYAGLLVRPMPDEAGADHRFVTTEQALRASNGDTVWLRTTRAAVIQAGHATDTGAAHAAGSIISAVDITHEKLREAAARNVLATLGATHTLVTFDVHGIVVDANKAFLEASGYRRAEIIGRHHRMFVVSSEAQTPQYAAFWRSLAAGRTNSGLYRRVARSGREIQLQLRYEPVRGPDGRVIGVVASTPLMSAVVDADAHADIFADGPVAALADELCVSVLSPGGIILDVNARCAELVGYTAKELIGRSHQMMVDPEVAASPEHRELWSRLLDGEVVSGMWRRVGKDGGVIWVQASYNPVPGSDGRPSRIMVVATDVTSNHALIDAARDRRRQPRNDPTTAMPNRARLMSFMASVLESGCGMVVLYLDLDRFGAVSDRFGHHAGEHVLAEVADRLRRSLSYDQFAAHTGVDEFVIVAPDMRHDVIDAFCARLIGRVGAPILFEGGQQLGVGLSIGVAVAPADGSTADELLRAAHIALTRAKDAGGGRFGFHSNTLNERLFSYQTQVAELRAALGGDEFFLEFQPRYHTASQIILGAEALVRWQHPRQGRIPPADFIPVAEKSGLILALGAWVLREACREAASWPGISVSVNISPVQIFGDDVVALVRSVLQETGLSPARLELEITEGTLSDAKRARIVLTELKALGVRIAMDDFGTGFSSLSSLSSYPFDVLKIDKQFIDVMGAETSGRQIVQAILGMGRALALSVTAEGVETEDQLAMLADDGCLEVQGYLLSRPISATQLRMMLTAQSESAAGAALTRQKTRGGRLRRALRSAIASDTGIRVADLARGAQSSP